MVNDKNLFVYSIDSGLMIYAIILISNDFSVAHLNFMCSFLFKRSVKMCGIVMQIHIYNIK